MILNINTFENHIEITRTVLPKYHVAVWARSKYAYPFVTNKFAKKIILKMLRIKNVEIKNRILLILVFLGIGVDRFSIRSR